MVSSSGFRLQDWQGKERYTAQGGIIPDIVYAICAKFLIGQEHYSSAYYPAVRDSF